MRRRSWLKLGIGAGAVLLLGGGAAVLIAPGLRESRLTPDAQRVMRAVGIAVIGGVLPADAAARDAALAGMLQRVDQLVAALPSHAQAELSQLLALLSTGAGRRTLAGLQSPWDTAAPADVEAALQDMRLSSLALRQQAYQALHDIAGAAYFSDPVTWSVLGYPGPAPIG